MSSDLERSSLPLPNAETRHGLHRREPVAFWRRAALYPDVYAWYVLFSALDIMMTWIILHLDGVEVNVLARWVIELGGLPGMVAYKFVLVMIVVAICEIVGRRREGAGRRLAAWAVAITVFPVVVAFAQLIHDKYLV